jgi:hypothetical protein
VSLTNVAVTNVVAKHATSSGNKQGHHPQVGFVNVYCAMVEQLGVLLLLLRL